jgi:hypothetical protein
VLLALEVAGVGVDDLDSALKLSAALRACCWLLGLHVVQHWREKPIFVSESIISTRVVHSLETVGDLLMNLDWRALTVDVHLAG